jgi:3-hydroxybutyryl-CoA dehydrogenase
VARRIGVVGAGTMGWGIAQLGCLGGFETVLHDPFPEALAAGAQKLQGALAKGAARGRWSEAEARAAADRLETSEALEGLAGCELVVEAAPEKIELKRELFAQLARACGPEAVLATNTSSLSVTAIAAGVERPERVAGMHFFNPPALMRLVEVVAGNDTAPEATALITRVAEAMGRTPIQAADGIGFVANRCARPFSLEALRIFSAGIAEPDQIDRIVRIGGGYRMGPFELTDLVGIDVNLEVAKSFWEQSFHEPRWQPHPIQARMVAGGRLGRKSGRGYYDYSLGEHRPADPDGPPQAAATKRDPEIERLVEWVALPSLEEAVVVEIARGANTTAEELARAGLYFTALGKHVECLPRHAPGLVLGRIVSQLVNEAHFALGEGVASAEDIDTALRLGLNHPRGPFEWCDAIGAGNVVAILDRLHSELGEERYRVAPLLRARAASPAA